MRTHKVFPALQPWSWRIELMRELVRDEHLVAARLEPVTRGREPTAFLDLHFSDGERSVTVPLVYVDLAQLDLREFDPLVFPHGVLGIVTDTHAREVVERVFPDLERRAMNGGFWTEEVISYGAAPIFDAARGRGFFGAAPLVTALPRIAAAIYARRFAVDKHVVTFGPQALELAGFLGGIATTCKVLGDDPVARVYYGSFDSGAADASYDLAVGSGAPPEYAAVTVRTDGGAADGVRVFVEAPLPADVMLTFSADDDAAVTAFSVVTTREPFARPVPDVEVPLPAGRSAGRIAVVVRPDALRAPDSDSAEALALAEILRHEGFTAEVLCGRRGRRGFRPRSGPSVRRSSGRCGAPRRGVGEHEPQAARRPRVARVAPGRRLLGRHGHAVLFRLFGRRPQREHVPRNARPAGGRSRRRQRGGGLRTADCRPR